MPSQSGQDLLIDLILERPLAKQLCLEEIGSRIAMLACVLVASAEVFLGIGPRQMLVVVCQMHPLPWLCLYHWAESSKKEHQDRRIR